jgi:carboxyl-terminal processing protease
VPLSALPQTKPGSKGAVYEQLNLFGEAFERIRQDAVEPVGDSRLVETAITGMLAALDPHAVYLTEAEFKAQQAPPSADEAGSTGLVTTIENGQVKVVSPRDGSGAAEAGIKPGDVIFMIDKEPTFEMTSTDVEQRLRGPVGSEVTLLTRRGNAAPTEIKVKRTSRNLPTVTSRLETGTIGYIRIAGFDPGTEAAFVGALDKLRADAGGKLLGYVIDLRNNPGGSFDAAVQTADAVIDKGDIAVIKSRNPNEAKHIAATPGDHASGLPIVALVNGGTANEAELVAGALQDNRRAVLLGTKTFGESAIVTTIPLNGNGAIRLTTSRFQTPNGRVIQGKGLDPDLVVAPVKLERLAVGDRRREADLRGALKNTDPVVPPAPPGKEPAKPAAPAPSSTAAPSGSVATADIGTSSDEQLTEALDVLHGLAMTSARNTK